MKSIWIIQTAIVDVTQSIEFVFAYFSGNGKVGGWMDTITHT